MAGNVVSLWKTQADDAGGRDAELSALCRGYEEARTASAARFFFVRGPAGVGKSHLFSLFRTQMLSRGVPVFEAESGRDARRPFGLFAQMLANVIDEIAKSGEAADSLAALTRKVAPVLGRESADGAQERLDLYDAVSELFSLVGKRTPVFLFPDLDVTDGASLELFRYLAAVFSAPESAGAGLFVASFRDEGELPAPLADTVNRVSAQSLSLAGFDLDGIRAYLSQPGVAERLYEATGGVPAALEALVHAPPAAPLELLHRRVEKLSEAGRTLLSMLSLAPNGALDADTIKDALVRAQGPLASVANELDALVREKLLGVRVGGGVALYRFARDSDRKLYGERLSADARRRFQKALGEVLFERGDLLSAADLLLSSDPRGSGIGAAKDAAKSLIARGAHEEAERLLGRVLEVQPKADRAWAHAQLADIAWTRGNFREVLFHLVRARPAGERGTQDAALFERAARALAKLGRVPFADSLLAPALEGAGGDEVTARAAVTRAELWLAKNESERVLNLSKETLPRLKDWPEHAIGLRNAAGKAHLLRGELTAAASDFVTNEQTANEAGLPALAAQARINQGVVAHRQGDFERAIRLYESGLLEGERTSEAHALAGLGSVYAETGDFERALDYRTRAMRAFNRMRSAREAAQAASNLARLHLFLGDLVRADELAQHALENARELKAPYVEASALLTLGTSLLERNEFFEAKRLLARARTLFDETGNAGFSALAIANWARASLRLGDRAEAVDALSTASLDAGAAALPAAALELELVRTEVALAGEDIHEATRAIGRARDLLLEKPDLEGPHRVHFLMAKLKAQGGDAAGAQTETARAARMLEEVVTRVPPARRAAFLSLPRRAEVTAVSEPEMRLPRVPVSLAPVREQTTTYGLIGTSPAMQRVGKQLEPVAKSNATVLIRGESGTGKELLAQALHDFSPRKAMPLVKVNCAAMVEDLLLSELFGHEKGAFTGAVRERKGRFELADGGTIFLDEIGDISPKCQVALLRALQEREFQRVGGTKTIKVDVRVICATNRDLETLIAQGLFRQDLYYRLKGVMLELPSLRERLDDLQSLSTHFLARIAKDRGDSPKRLSGEALAVLSRYDWPGNVRELENVLSSAVIFAEGDTIRPEALAHVGELSALMSGQSAPRLPTPNTSLTPMPASRMPVSPAPAPAASTAAAAAAMPSVAEMLAPPGPIADAPPPFPAFAGGSLFGDDEEGDEDDDLPLTAETSLPLTSAGGSPGGELDFYSLARNSGLSLKELRQQIEMQCIQSALVESKGNISEAARLLRMKRSRLSQIVNADPSLRGLANDV